MFRTLWLGDLLSVRRAMAALADYLTLWSLLTNIAND